MSSSPTTSTTRRRRAAATPTTAGLPRLAARGGRCTSTPCRRLAAAGRGRARRPGARDGGPRRRGGAARRPGGVALPRRCSWRRRPGCAWSCSCTCRWATGGSATASRRPAAGRDHERMDAAAAGGAVRAAARKDPRRRARRRCRPGRTGPRRRRRAAVRRGGDAGQGPRRPGRGARATPDLPCACACVGSRTGTRRSPTACGAPRAGRPPRPGASPGPRTGDGARPPRTPPRTWWCSPPAPRPTAWWSPRRWRAASRCWSRPWAGYPRPSGTAPTAAAGAAGPARRPGRARRGAAPLARRRRPARRCGGRPATPGGLPGWAARDRVAGVLTGGPEDRDGRLSRPDWLALREPADAEARATDLLEPSRASAPRPAAVIHDLGCGTGSMGRWLAPRLPGRQHWIMYDRDPDLLDHAAAVVARPPTAPPSPSRPASATSPG